MILRKVVEYYVFFICAKSRHCSWKSTRDIFVNVCFSVFVHVNCATDHMHCSLLCPLLCSAVYNYIILLMPHYCTEIILWRFITYLLLLFIKTFHSKLIQVFNFFFTFQFCCLHNLCLLFTFFPLFFFLWTFTGWTCGVEFRG